ncbi:MAG TPA: hypothetical protein VLK27_00205 [Chthoniobacterales bacterium]|nr:hypothetical protein [Chthoniobacterales bacterium]
MVSHTDIAIWVASGLLALGIGLGKYSKYKTRQKVVREFANMDPEHREKMLSRMQPDTQMEIRQELMKRFRVKSDL